MKVLIISDSHGIRKTLREVFARVGEIDMLIHLGDVCGDELFIKESFSCPVHIIAGNNDYSLKLLKEEIIEIADKQILLTHGHKYYVNYDYNHLAGEAAAIGMDMVMFGHTHVPLIEDFDGIKLINPGSLAYPRQSNRKGSFIIMEVDSEKNFHFSIDYLS